MKIGFMNRLPSNEGCMKNKNTKVRCPWAGNDPEMIHYHDANLNL